MVAAARAVAALMASAVVAACTTRAAVFPTASSEEPPRKPFAPTSASNQLPSPEASAAVSSHLVVLAAPEDVESARGLVRTFFRAVTMESLDAVNALVDQGGRLWTGSGGRRESLASAWARRLNQLDYSVLEGKAIFRESEVEIYRPHEASELQESRRLPLSPRPGELLVRVHLVTPVLGGTRLFGDELSFLLRPADSGYKIGEIYEDFRLP